MWENTMGELTEDEIRRIVSMVKREIEASKNIALESRRDQDRYIESIIIKIDALIDASKTQIIRLTERIREVIRTTRSKR